jgi:phosphoglycerate kinase
MAKLFIKDLPLKGKKVLVRVDFNVPIDSKGDVADATRIEAALPTIQYILSQGGIPILMSHLGRPTQENQKEFSLKPVAKKLSSLLHHPVTLASNCIGDKVREQIAHLRSGEILLLENLRFHRAEEHPETDPHFALELAALGDLYVNDAFGTAHRKHSSTYTIATYFPGKAAAGFLLEKEIRFLGDLLQHPRPPFYALIGGAKISTKIGVIESLLKRVERLFIGGGMAYTFLQAQGVEIGDSLVDNAYLSQAASLLKKYPEQLLLPVDWVAAPSRDAISPTRIFSLKEGILPGYQGLDIGPQTIALFQNKLQDGNTILWNGPLGVYEIDRFAKGTLELARYIAKLPATTVIGGGDLIAAFNRAGVAGQVSHISTGGGATLEYIEYGTLPGIEALSSKN